MDIFNVLSMVGGLALFLYGMKVMGDALSKYAGGRLERILETMTSSPIKGVLLGAAVTAVIQSSSATTVMVVGFVNSGIMKLSQAVGVIMGANIGTTVTSWILSLTGIQSSNIFIQMLKPASFTPILAVVGIIFLMFNKDEKKNDIGTILLGFTVLMFGMETMSAAVKPLADIPEFTSLFTAFENPILGMIVGATLTAIIQSSSASVGILQAMCITGSVSVASAVPIIMGQNIGTCVTALISSIGASKNAKRASLVHLYFNVIGTVLFMVVFYSVNVFIHFEFLNDIASPATIAVIHSIFNICATLVLLPMSRIIEKLAYMTIPQTQEEQKVQTEPQVLDERFLERPAFAVAQCKTALVDIAKLVEESMLFALKLSREYSDEDVKKIIDIENIVDEKEDELSNYMTQLSAKSLSNEDSKLLSQYGRCMVDFERITDYLKGIAYTCRKMNKDKQKFSDQAIHERDMIFKATYDIIDYTVSSFVHDDLEIAATVDPLEEVINTLKDQIKLNHNERLAKHECTIEQGMALNDIVISLGRIANHCSNIAEEEIIGETDTYAIHEFTRRIKENNETYRELLQDYKDKYAI